MQLNDGTSNGVAKEWMQNATENQAATIDVTQLSTALHFGLDVHMESEAFGVAVTRRAISSPQQVTADERGRLLDVLCHANAIQGQCLNQEKVFQVWLIPSDAKDSRSRLTWFTLQRLKNAYLISLSDV